MNTPTASARYLKIWGLEPPLGVIGVGSHVGGPLYDARILRRGPRFGTFKTIQESHRWIRGWFDTPNHPGNPGNVPEAVWRDIKDMIAIRGCWRRSPRCWRWSR